MRCFKGKLTVLVGVTSCVHEHIYWTMWRFNKYTMWAQANALILKTSASTDGAIQVPWNSCTWMKHGNIIWVEYSDCWSASKAENALSNRLDSPLTKQENIRIHRFRSIHSESTRENETLSALQTSLPSKSKKKMNIKTSSFVTLDKSTERIVGHNQPKRSKSHNTLLRLIRDLPNIDLKPFTIAFKTHVRLKLSILIWKKTDK